MVLRLKHLDGRRQLETLGFVAIVALGGWLRLHHLGSDSIWLDEAVSWVQASRPIPDLLRATAADNYPPLHNLILHAAIALFGDAEWSLRLPSALLGTANVGLVTLIACRLRGPRAAIMAGILLALAPFDIWYSQEARMYALLEFASLAFAWSILHYRQRRDVRAAWLSAAAALLLLYSHLFGSFVWLALGMSGALMLRHDRPALMRLAKAQLAACIGFLPWAWILLQRSGVVARQGFWIAPLTLSGFYDTYLEIAGGSLLLVAMLSGAALAIRSAFDARTPRDERSTIGLLAMWLILPPLIAAVISLVSVSLFLSRYLIGTVPALILLAAIGFDWLAGSIAERSAPSRPRLLAAWSIPLILGVAVAWSWHVATRPIPRVDWRRAARSVEGVITPADCIVIVPYYEEWPLHYYRRDPDKCLIGVHDPEKLTLPADPPSAIFVFSTFKERNAGIVVQGLAKQGWHGEVRMFHRILVWRLTRS